MAWRLQVVPSIREPYGNLHPVNLWWGEQTETEHCLFSIRSNRSLHHPRSSKPNGGQAPQQSFVYTKLVQALCTLSRIKSM
jgi:hypothetical protein